MTVPTLRLLHGAEIPQLGLGTTPMTDDEAERVVADAIAAGYRLLDTAENYGNEIGVGAGIKASGVAREELFVTTKFNKRWHGRDLAAEAFEGSIDRLGLDYLDLLLIHWPNPGQDQYVQAWDGLVQLLEAGRVRAIGTSNFKPAHLDPPHHQADDHPGTRRVRGLQWLELGRSAADGTSLLQGDRLLKPASRPSE
jgi:2,5-diketo-D-gluconate reductase A